MTFRALRLFRHLVAASMLLMTAGIGAEIYLRSHGPDAVSCVTTTVCGELQSLLRPSLSTHHELVPLFSAASHSARLHADVRINQLGMRGADVANVASGGAYRILVLGDDTVFGPASSDSRQLTALLRHFLDRNATRPLEVLNGGVPGYCPLLSMLQYRHQLMQLRPDLVILHFDMSDVADDIGVRRFLVAREGQLFCEHPALTAGEPGGLASSVFQTARQSALASTLLDASWQSLTESRVRPEGTAAFISPYQWIADSPPDLRIAVRHALSPLLELNQMVTAGGGRLLVTTCPVLWQIRSGAEAPELTRACGVRGVTPFRSELPFQILQQYCAAHNILFCDSSPAFRGVDGENGELFSHVLPTLSDQGMALYAREIALFLVRRGSGEDRF